VGAHEPGSRLEVAMPDHPGSLAEVAGIFRDAGMNISSVVAAPAREAGDERRVAVFRVGTINPGEAVERLEGSGYHVLWPPRR
jgi:acetoin utilization protein AcuB